MELVKDRWTRTDYGQFCAWIAKQGEEKYAAFHCKLVPGLGTILGVRMPMLRRIGREIAKGHWQSFLKQSKDEVYEQVLLQGLIISGIALPFAEFVPLMDRYADKIDNWALCDSFCAGMKQAKSNRAELFEYLKKYLKSDSPWHVRTGLVIMLDHYLDPEYLPRALARCDKVKSEHYYVRMAQAWLVSIAYSKDGDRTMQYLQECTLDDWTFNKAIQKARESYRVSEQEKERLRGMMRRKAGKI